MTTARNASMFLTDDFEDVIVFNIGGFNAHFGYSATNFPSLKFPTLIGKFGNDDKPLIGEDSLNAIQSGLDLKRIIIDGKIEDWDAYESMIEYAYSNCYYHPSKEYAVLISDSPLNTLRERERLCELMFRERNTEGLTSSHLRFFEDELLTYMMKLLFEVNTDCTYRPGELEQLPARPFAYPNGFMREFREERFRYPEALFNPRIFDVQHPSYSLTRTIAASIKKCDTNLIDTLMGNIICTGGPSEIPSFDDRLSNEIARKMPESFRARVSQMPRFFERPYCSYIGASILSSLSGLQEKWVRKVDYEERGRQAVHKCQY
ncbi:hypothetical protein ACOME3_010296 [Neoechinorhynchus agilis]